MPYAALVLAQLQQPHQLQHLGIHLRGLVSLAMPGCVCVSSPTLGRPWHPPQKIPKVTYSPQCVPPLLGEPWDPLKTP